MEKPSRKLRFSRYAGHRHRLASLEQLLLPMAPKILEEESISEEEFLAHLRMYDRLGYFRQETDFPRALQEYEDALKRAQHDPHFLPPSEFMPGESEVRRRRYWRQSTTPHDLQRCMQWLIAMLNRVMEGIPAVTHQEWHAMKQWYLQHRDNLPEWTVEIQNNQYQSQEMDSVLQSKDDRDLHAGEYLMVLRELYARYHQRL